MKRLLIGINSKYIHPNIAIRLLKANTNYAVDIKEFNIKDDINKIYNYIISNNYNVIFLWYYINALRNGLVLGFAAIFKAI